MGHLWNVHGHLPFNGSVDKLLIEIDRPLNIIELDLEKIRDIQYFHFWQKIVPQIQSVLP